MARGTDPRTRSRQTVQDGPIPSACNGGSDFRCAAWVSVECGPRRRPMVRRGRATAARSGYLSLARHDGAGVSRVRDSRSVTWPGQMVPSARRKAREHPPLARLIPDISGGLHGRIGKGLTMRFGNWRVVSLALSLAAVLGWELAASARADGWRLQCTIPREVPAYDYSTGGEYYAPRFPMATTPKTILARP